VTRRGHWVARCNIASEVGFEQLRCGLQSLALPVKQRNVIWSIGAGLVLTRVVLLAHWASDVAAGLVVGAQLPPTKADKLRRGTLVRIQH
jgi:hypothetical protein